MPPIGHLYHLHELTHDTSVTLSYAVLSDRDDPRYNSVCHDVLDKLQTQKLFDVARQFADATGLPCDHITIKQVIRLTLSDFRTYMYVRNPKIVVTPVRIYTYTDFAIEKWALTGI